MSGASPAPPGLAPMYGAPQTPTPVAVPQEECIVTSSYEAPPPSRPTYDSGPPQQSATQGPPQQHHAAPMPGPHQVQQPQQQQQQQHYQGYQQPLYHQQGAQYHNPPAPQYHQMPGPVVHVQFTQQHPQPQPQQQLYQQQQVARQGHTVHPGHPVPGQHQQHYPHQPLQVQRPGQQQQQFHGSGQQQQQQQQATSQGEHQGGMARSAIPANRFVQMSPGGPGPQQRFVMVRQSPGGASQQLVQVVKPGSPHVGGQQAQRFQLVQQQAQPGSQGVRQVLIRQQPHQLQQQGQHPQQQQQSSPHQQQQPQQPSQQQSPHPAQQPSPHPAQQPSPHPVQQQSPSPHQQQSPLQQQHPQQQAPGQHPQAGQHPQQQQQHAAPHQQQPVQHQQQFGGPVLRPQTIMRPLQPQQVGGPVRYRVQPPQQVVPVQLRPEGPMQNGQVMRPQMLRPGGPMPRPMIGGPGAARGVIQHSGLGGQGGYGGQVVGPQYGARPLVQQGVWRGGQQPPGPPVQRMVRPGGPPQHLGPGGQMRAGQQYGMQPQQQQGKDNIAYNVEHVFKDENGREVRKMPVEIEGETIWVECVPGGAGERQDGGDGAIVLNMEDHEEIPKAVVKPPNSGLTTKNLTPEQRQQIINECVEEMISPTDLARKWNCNADTIRTWVRKAGLTLPKQYKKSIYPDSGNAPARAMGRSTPSTSSGYPPMGAVSQGLSGVTTGAMTPPSIDSPPCSSGGEGSALSASSSGGSGSGQVSKRIPGKLAMCKSCGFTSEDLAICVRCRRKMPDDVKILDDPSYKPKPDSTELMGTKKLRLARLPGKRNRRPGNPDEPVCIALSSDEEGGDEDENSRSSTAEQTGDQQGRRVGLEEQGDDGVVVEERITDGSVAGPWCSLPCRSIRIGNYKVLPKDKLTVTARGIQFKVPGILPPQEVITIAIGMNDILKVLAHFGKSMPLLFLYVSQDACARVRRQLKMVNNQSFFLEVQSPDETQKRITILPEKLTEENKAVLKQHFESKLQELESKDANEILVRSSPKDIAMLKAKMIGTHMQGGSKNTAMAEQAVVKYCQYPPDSPGNVSITNEDYNCLEAEQFLNDVIIDFYLKYIQTELFGTVDQWSKRTHIFTTYFYKRLTTRPPNSKTKAHPIEDNPNLSAAEKRYERVKKWTKKVNIFDKDFIVVPINEHAHWFVCVICFPGQEGCVRADDGTACEPVASSKTPGTKKKKRAVKKPTMQIGATTIIPLSGREDVAIRYNVEEDSDRDEAEASDDDMEDEEGEGVEARKPGEEGEGSEPPPAVRRPCILIFDSLKGGSKARTCQTLRDYLSCEWKAKMVPNGKEERRFDNGLMPGSQPTVQQQPNFSDCGIYLLQYIQSFFRDPISDYNFPIRSVRQWFSKEEVEGKRGNIAELIRKLTGEQNPEKEINFPQLNFLNPEIEGEESEEEDEEEDEGGERQPPTSAVVGSSVVRLTAAPANATPGRLLVTPAKQQGKVLIQKTGTFNSTQLAALTAVPPGVTVTPARTLATNISIRKVQPVSSSRPMPSASTSSSSSAVVAMGDTIQTSPDSTSHEDSYGEGSNGGRSEADGQGDHGLPDSQGFESGKRSAETPDGEIGRVKRTKSEEET